jgi:hypothetical protein
MALTVERYGGDGTTVPYGEIFDDIRNNSGFVDTRGRPDVAANIPEGAASPALKGLLVRLASEGKYFSLGCDLGGHEEPESPSTKRFVAGGYVQLTCFHYQFATTYQHDAFASAIEKNMLKRSRGRHWRMWLEGRWVIFKLKPKIKAPTTWVWFFALERTDQRAREGRETVINELSDALHDDEVIGVFR